MSDHRAVGDAASAALEAWERKHDVLAREFAERLADLEGRAMGAPSSADREELLARLASAGKRMAAVAYEARGLLRARVHAADMQTIITALRGAWPRPPKGIPNREYAMDVARAEAVLAALLRAQARGESGLASREGECDKVQATAGRPSGSNEVPHAITSPSPAPSGPSVDGPQDDLGRPSASSAPVLPEIKAEDVRAWRGSPLRQALDAGLGATPEDEAAFLTARLRERLEKASNG